MLFESVLNHCVYCFISVPRNKAGAEDSYINEPGVYELPDNVMERFQRNESTGHPSSSYMSLKDSKEPSNVYQSLQNPHIHTEEYQNHAFISRRAKYSAR